MIAVARAFALGIVAVLLAACGARPEATDLWEVSVIRKAKERGKLVVATEAEFPPFESRDGNGKLVGFDIDLCRDIGKLLGAEVEFHDVKFDTIAAEVTSGKADLIASGMTITPDRALTLTYTQPYYQTVTALLVSKKRASDVHSVEDLNRKDRVIAVKQGTTGQKAAEEKLPNATLRPLDTENAAALEVALGRADAFLYDLHSVRIHHREHPDETFLLETPVTVEPYALAVRKGDPEAITWLNVVLEHLRKTGRLKELYARHGLPEPEGLR